MVETPPQDWRCSYCGVQRNIRKKNRENFVGRHVYLFGDPRCTPCARQWHDAQKIG